MSDIKRHYKIGYGKPPSGRPFQKGQSGNPRGRPRNDLSTLLVAALNEPVLVTTEGEQRRITKREAIVTQLVNKSTTADLLATKMLIDMLKSNRRPARRRRAGRRSCRRPTTKSSSSSSPDCAARSRAEANEVAAAGAPPQ